MSKPTTWVAAYIFALAVFAVVGMWPIATAWAADDTAQMKSDIEELKKQVKEANEWKKAESKVHLAGYTSATYTDIQNEDGGFTQALFAPIFHYLFNDLVMLEAELEFSADTEGETEVSMEYAATDIFINNNLMVVAGEFLSPLGQFRQNLHPSWINKMTSHPPGFGEEDGAATVSVVGAEARGGFALGKTAMANYAAYIGNGPQVEAAGGELVAVNSEGHIGANGQLQFGGRFGILPFPKLEIGVSAAAGKTSVTKNDGADLDDDPERDYTVAGADFVWHFHNNFEWRGEYIQQEVDSASGSVAPGDGKWRSWYTQLAYKFYHQKWEVVARYTDFDSAEDELDQKQWGLGINYLFSSNLMAKLDFYSNDGEAGTIADDNTIEAQIAYGF